MAAKKKPAKKAPSKSGFTYTIRRGGPIKEKDGAVIAKYLHKLIRDRGGILSPKELWEEARDPNSPVHGYIEWDVKTAAKRYQLRQCAEIIKCVQYEVKTGKIVIDVPAFVRVVNNNTLPEAKTNYGYVTTPTAATEINFEQQILNKALQDLKNFQARYDRYREVFSTLKPIFEAIAKVEKVIQQQTTKPKKSK